MRDWRIGWTKHPPVEHHPGLRGCRLAESEIPLQNMWEGMRVGPTSYCMQWLQCLAPHAMPPYVHSYLPHTGKHVWGMALFYITLWSAQLPVQSVWRLTTHRPVNFHTVTRRHSIYPWPGKGTSLYGINTEPKQFSKMYSGNPEPIQQHTCG